MNDIKASSMFPKIFRKLCKSSPLLQNKALPATIMTTICQILGRGLWKTDTIHSTIQE